MPWIHESFCPVKDPDAPCCHKTWMDEPRIVAECWTCCDGGDHIGEPLPVYSRCERGRITKEDTARWHRAAGHDVRPIEPEDQK